jgi:hypothetical protein
MAKFEWANNGEAFEKDGKMIFSASVDLEIPNGPGVQVFEGETHKEVADKLLAAQLSASGKIREQAAEIDKLTPAPVVHPASTGPNADQRFAAAQDITDPDKIESAVEAVVGVPLDKVRKLISREEQREGEERVRAASVGFVEETADYDVCSHNEKLMINYMGVNSLDLGKKEDYAEAWKNLKAAGLAKVKGETAPPEEAPAQNGGLPASAPVTIRQRGVLHSTGIRAGESSGAPAATAAAPTKYTKADIEAMPANVYEWKLKNEAGFAKFIDALLAPAAPK